MIGFDPKNFISKVTLLFMMNANVAIAQQYVGGTNQSDVIVDYSVLESLGTSPNVSRKKFNQPSKEDGANNLYTGPKLRFPEASRSQPSSKIDVIALKPPRSIKKLFPNRSKKGGKGVSNKIHGNSSPKVHKTRMVRPPPPPHLSEPLKKIKALPAPKFSDFLQRSLPPPPAIPVLGQVVKLPPISSIKVPTKNFLPVSPKFSKSAANSKTRVASIPSIDQHTKAESISRIEFNAGSFKLNKEASAILEKLSKTLEKNLAFHLQLYAYASVSGGSAIKAKRVALSRALAARAYLIDRGVDITRIAVKALGDQSNNGPTERIDIILTIR